jgi:hypothetical protein
MAFRGRMLSVGSVVLIAACSAARQSVAPTICTAVAIPAIELTVRDAVTGSGVARAAEVVAQQSSTSGVLVGVDTGYAVDSSTMVIGAMPGVYDLSLTNAGYVPWTRKGVTAPAADPEGCHPVTQLLEADLQPSN